ncbi:acyltransferase [Mucilaginibacter sp. HD30]
MKIDYENMPNGAGKFIFTLRYIFNILRTWYIFHIRYPWVKYDGFVRVMAHTSFAKMDIELGHHVQFGNYCNVASDVKIGNYVLMAGRVCFVGKNDHDFSQPGKYIWQGERGEDGTTIVEDDVWIGHNAIVIAGVTIGKGSIIAAGSVVNKDVPACEIWGGVPARKIRDRFISEKVKKDHIQFLENQLVRKSKY